MSGGAGCLRAMSDKYYDYSRFDDERLRGIMASWDGLGGNHGLVIKLCADKLVGDTVLDVGCGLCHLYDVLKDRVTEYVGVDNDERVVDWARHRYPSLQIEWADVRDLFRLGDRRFDTVYAIGLYRKPEELIGIEEMLKHARKALIITYLHRRDAGEKYLPKVFFDLLRDEWVESIEIFGHRINGIEIVRFNLLT